MTLDAPELEFPRLVFHGLAFLQLSEPGNLNHRAYQHWCASALPPDAYRALEEDAELISARLTSASVPLHALVHAAPSVASFRSAPFTSAKLPQPLRGVDPVGLELFDIALRRCADPFAEAIAGMPPAPETPRLNEVRRLLREFEKVNLRPVHAVRSLGPRGRGYPHVIYVGWAGFLGLDEDTPAAITLHEELVMNAPDSSYAVAERYALQRARELPLSAPLRGAHERWLSSLDLTGLV